MGTATTPTTTTPTIPRIDTRAAYEHVPHILSIFLHIAIANWHALLILGGLAVLKIAISYREHVRLSRSGIHEIDVMDGRKFESYLATLFRRLGYAVDITQYRGDYGADLVVSQDGRRVAVQAKRWTKPVGVKAVQEAAAAIAMYHCDSALVVTNRSFTEPAKKLARANQIGLWDRDILISKLLEAGGGSSGLQPEF